MTTPTTPTNRGVSPVIVALLRSLLYAVVVAAGTAVVAFTDGLSAESLGEHAWALPLLLAGGRTLEGVVDRFRGQQHQTIGGSKPASPLAYLEPADIDTLANAGAVDPPPATPAIAEAVDLAGDDLMAPPRDPDMVTLTHEVRRLVDRFDGLDATFLEQAIARAMPRSQATTRDRVLREVADALRVPLNLEASATP